MPRITEELVRRRAEHNEGDIATLEELSLHQQELERIEHLDRWCRGLKILYLQNNLIPQIENVGRLKQLEYLNLALNNIERIENLEGCEFLQKLDLTVNFVGDLLSVESLRGNPHFRELYLTGNPCTDYEGYREFVVAALPRLQWLDGKEVSKSERILATQNYPQLREKIVVQQKAYQAKRERQKREHKQKEVEKEKKNQKQPGFDGHWYTDVNSHLQQSTKTNGEESVNTEGGENETVHPTPGDEEDEKFWNEPTAYTPESRTEVHQYMAERRKDKAKSPDNKGLQPHKRTVRLERDGKLLNVNEGRYDFQLKEDDDNNQYILEVAIPRYMDTSLVDCDVQPDHVRLQIKGKILQLVLQEEVSPDRCTAKRSQTSGSLLVTLPKAREVLRPRCHFKKESSSLHTQPGDSERDTHTSPSGERREVSSGAVDFRNIVTRQEVDSTGCEDGHESQLPVPTGNGGVLGNSLIQELDTRVSNGIGRDMSSDLGDTSEEDSDVPPLI